MALRHRIRINVMDKKAKNQILEGAERRLPMRLIRWLFGDFTTVYLLLDLLMWRMLLSLQLS